MKNEKNIESKVDLCPDCERYVGPVSSCPYCGSPTLVAASRRRLKLTAWTLVLFGMFFLYMMAISKEPTVIAVANITPAMNYAAVRVVGRVTKKPYIIRKKKKVSYISFEIDDKSGTLRIFARDKVAALIAGKNILPHKGEQVSVCGKLTVRGDTNYRLEILTSDGLKPEI